MKIISWNINGIRSKSMNLLNKDKSFNIESPLAQLIQNYNLYSQQVYKKMV